MIYEEKYGKVVSSLGWIDKGSILIHDTIKNITRNVRLSDADYLMLFKGSNGYFSILHVYKDNIQISIHHFEAPDEILSNLTWVNDLNKKNLGIWHHVPNYYTVGFSIADHFDFHLVQVEAERLVLQDDKIKWYREGNFDFMYQGLTSVTEYNNELIFTVQRDGSLYRFNVSDNKLEQRIVLAGNSGNPYPHIGNGFLWTVDYDTLVQVSLKDWQVKAQKKLQGAEKGVAHFIGDVSLSLNNSLCIVPRPFSGDVITLNKNLKLKHTCVVGKQPLEAAIIDNKVIARDWKTGELLQGKLKKLFFF
jgi:hypothetical protein